MIRPFRHVRTGALLLALGLLTFSARGDDAPAAVAKPMVHTGLGSATDAAARDGALVLAVFESETCPACQELDKTLASPAFADKAGLLHVLYFDVDAAPKTATAFRVDGVPDLVLMTAEMKIVSRLRGAAPAEELVKWIAQARLRVARGTWDGTALDGPAGELISGASGPEGMKRLVQALGDAESETAERAGDALEARRDAAVPSLIDGLDDPYLAVRIGSSELLRRLAPDSPKIDPWDAPAARLAQSAQVREWWNRAKTLPAIAPTTALAPEEARSAQEAISGVLSQDPLSRTRGMTTLVRLGNPVLPRLREAIRKCGDAGDAKSLCLLEDVRWAILIPDALELKANVRRSLARGTSEERQAAAGRLGSEESAALPPLRELIDDSDTLVRESAVHALSKVGGTDSLAAIAELLKAKDTNLRMVAAQALSSSKNLKAAPYLVTAVNDPDEVVACVAIAGLEEVQAKDQAKVLVGCLSDKRWRVRAAAAEVIGKLQLKDAGPELLKRLEDTDPFVVKSALTALRSTEATPSPGALMALIKRTPALTSLAVECVVSTDSPETLKTVETIWDDSNVESRRDILDGLIRGRHYGGGSADEHWKGLLTKVSQSTDVLTRRKLADVLQQRSSPTASAFVGKLLEDEDMEVRVAAVPILVGVAGYHWGVGGDSAQGDYGILYTPDPSAGEDAPEERPVTGRASRDGLGDLFRRVMGGDREDAPAKPKPRAERLSEIRQMYAHWHELLKPVLEKRPEAPVAVAFYVTGDGKTDLPVLASALERTELKEEIKKLPFGAMRTVVRRLPWPESKDLLDRACRAPFLYAQIAEALPYASKPVWDWAARPDQVVAAVEASKGSDFEQVVELLFETGNSRGEGAISLYAPRKTNAEILKRLVESKSPGARAVGVFVAGTRSAAMENVRRPVRPEDLIVVEGALRDENPWVRCAAIQSTMVQLGDQQKREERLAPLLSDKNGAVATLAGVAILDENLRGAADLGNYTYFRFEGARVWRSYYVFRGISDREDNPLPAVIERKPGFLDVVRERLAKKSAEPPAAKDDGEDDVRMEYVFTLLLAQYGDFSGIEKELTEWSRTRQGDASPLLFIGLALSKDARYLEPVKATVEKTTDRSDLRRMLKWLEGVKGKDARDLRRTINRRMQSAED